VSLSLFAAKGLLLELRDAFRGSVWFMLTFGAANAASLMDFTSACRLWYAATITLTHFTSSCCASGGLFCCRLPSHWLVRE